MRYKKSFESNSDLLKNSATILRQSEIPPGVAPLAKSNLISFQSNPSSDHLRLKTTFVEHAKILTW